MSRDTETVAREFAEAFNTRDIDGLAQRACHHCVVVALRSELEGPYLGREGVRRWAESYIVSMPDARLVLERVITVGSDRVVVLGRQTGTAADGGATFDAPLAAVLELEAGLLARLTAFRSHEEALLGAGLDEEGR